MDSQELALASAKASLTTYAMFGTIESLGLDPATLDEATLAELMQQYMPQAVEQADRWLATLDPSTLPLDTKPKLECTEQFGCPYITQCKKAIPTYQLPSVKHMCMVTDCGDARCRDCPDWFTDILSHLVYRSWCAYVCEEANVYMPKVVAIGAGFIPAIGTQFQGPWCKDP